jgi:hypothetical protein
MMLKPSANHCVRLRWRVGSRSGLRHQLVCLTKQRKTAMLCSGDFLGAGVQTWAAMKGHMGRSHAIQIGRGHFIITGAHIPDTGERCAGSRRSSEIESFCQTRKRQSANRWNCRNRSGVEIISEARGSRKKRSGPRAHETPVLWSACHL